MAKLESGIFAFITTIISVIFTASLSSVASADVLQFGPGALPACAYDCVALYSAQYDCPEESSPGECFCTSKHLDALFQGHTPCEDQCPETGGGAGIKIWFNSVCVAYLKTSTTLPEPTTSTTDSSNPTGTSTTTTTKDNKSNQSADPGNRAVEWWKKNWHWFLIAFLIIIVPITVYALWFPCRKWTRKQIIQRRSRPSLPPVPPVDPTLVYKSHYSNGGLASPTRVTSPGIPPVPIGAFSNQQWADPFSPSLTRDGTGYFPHYVAPPTPSPVGAVRQESWERKVREEFEGKKTLGEKLAFWKKGRKGGEEDEEENMER